MRTDKQLTRRVRQIASIVDATRVKVIKRINRQLSRMSLNDLNALERLMGSR